MKMTISRIVAIVAIGLASVTKADAAASRQAEERRFKELDVNRDKQLSEDEFIGSKAGKARAKAKKQFKTLDTNRDEALSFKEFNNV